MKTLWDVAEKAAEFGGGFEFVADDGRDRFVAFTSMLDRARRIAGGLRALGIGAGERIGLILPENEEFLVGALGVVAAGCAMVPLYPPLHARLLEGFVDSTVHALTRLDVRALITTSTLRRLLGEARARSPGTRHIVALEALLSGEPVARPSLDPDAPVLIQSTSGSSARPKGVVIGHGQLLANISSIAGPHGMGLVGTDVGVSWLPLFHDMGLIGMALTTIQGCAELRVPGKTILMSPVFFIKRPIEWLRAMSRHKATISVAPNFAYGLVAKKATDEQLAELDLSSWRIAGCGAEPIRAETLRAFARRMSSAGFREEAFLPCYGMAEHTLAISFTPLGRPLLVDTVAGAELERDHVARPAASGAEGSREIVSCGRAFPGHGIRIVDEAGTPVGERCVGEIEVRGPSLMQGYFGEPRRAADAWFATGDFGYLAGGELYVCGRKKDLIIVRGKKLHPQDLEWALEGVPGIRPGGAAAFGSNAFRGEERVIVVVEVKADAASLPEKVRARLRETLGVEPDEVVVVEPGALPKTSSGKLQRLKLKSLYETGTPIRPPRGRHPVAHAIRSQLAYLRVLARRLVGRTS